MTAASRCTSPVGDRADLAEVLGDDEIGRELPERRSASTPMTGLPARVEPPHLGVDGGAPDAAGSIGVAVTRGRL